MTIVNPDLDPGARQRRNKKSKLYFFKIFNLKTAILKFTQK
jgi:hypothetical protein